MPNDIYNFLKQNNLTTKDEKTFLEEYSDPSKAQELYKFFKDNNLTQKDSSQFYDTYLKKKEDTALVGTSISKPSEESIPSTSIYQNSLIVDYKTKSPKKQSLDDKVYSEWQKELQKKIAIIEKEGIKGKPQTSWSSEDIKLVREYNGELNELSSMIQTKDVDNYLNVIKSDTQKALTKNTDEQKIVKQELAISGKLDKITSLRTKINDKGIKYGSDLSLVDNDPLKYWNKFDMPDWDKNLNIKTQRWIDMATQGSLIAKIAQSQMPDKEKYTQESIDIQSRYTPEKIEELAGVAFGFLLDTPLFNGLGALSGSVAKGITSSIYHKSISSITRDLVKQGISKELAEPLAIRAFSNTVKGTGAKMLERGLATSQLLGTYDLLNNVADQYKEAYTNGEDLDNFNWRQVLEAYTKGSITGFAVGSVSPLFSKASQAVDKAVETSWVRKASKLGVGVADFATESSVFAFIPAAIEGRIPTTKELYESGLMLAAIKGSNLPMTVIGKVNASKAGKNAQKDIEYTDRDLELLNLSTEKDVSRALTNMSDADIQSIAKDPKIPLILKYKVMMNEGGISPVGNMVTDGITLNEENGRIFIRQYTNSKEGLVLLSENEYQDKSVAEKDYKDGLQTVYEQKLSEYINGLPVKEKGIIETRLSELNKDELDRIFESWSTPVQMRTAENKADVTKLLKIVNEATGGKSGLSAYESELIPEKPSVEMVNTPSGIKESKSEIEKTGATGEKQVEIKGLEEKEVIPEGVQNKVIDLPQLKQQEKFDCGSCALREVLTANGEKITEDEMIKELGSNEKEGTLISNIEKAADKRGILVESKEGMTTDELDKYISNGNPILALIEGKGDYIEGKDYSKTEEGHYVVIKGKEGSNYIISDTNKEGDIRLTKEQLMERWHGLGDDMKTVVNQQGIVLKTNAKLKPIKEAKPAEEKVQQDVAQKIDVSDKLKDIESTKEALDDVDYMSIYNKIPESIQLKEGETSRNISEYYHKVKVDGSNPELVKAVEELIEKKGINENAQKEIQGEIKVEEETKNATREERIEEHQGVVQGQQEEGKGTGGERQEEVTETDTGDRAERSGKKEKEQALASINSITASFTVPDITAEQQKAAQDKLVEHINEQAKRFKHVSPQLTKYLTEEAAKVNAKNVGKKIAYINKVLENSEFASKVEEANTERKKIDLNRIKNESSKFDWLKDVVFNKRFKNRGQKITTWLNKIELSELGTNTDMVNDYINVLKGLNRKGIPDFAPLKDFAMRYRDVVQKSIDLNSVEVPATEFTADNLLNKAKELTTKIDELLNRDDVDAQEIVNVKRQAGSLASAIKTLVQNGDVRVEGEDFYIQNPEVAKLESFLETSGKFSENTRADIQRVEEEYKTKTLSDISKSIKDNKLQEQAITEQDALLLDNIQKLSERLKDDKVAQKALSVYDMDYLQKGVEQVGTSGVLPTKLYRLGKVILPSALEYSRTKPLFDRVFDNTKNTLRDKFLNKSAQDQIKEFMAAPDWDKLSQLGMVERIGKTRYDEYYDKILSPAREAVVQIEGEMNAFEKQLNENIIKTYKRGIIKKAWNYMFDVSDRNIQAKVTSARIGELMANLRFYYNIEGKNNIVQVGDTFRIVKPTGEKISENGNEKIFQSVDEAKIWLKDNKKQLIDSEILDFFYNVNRGDMKEKGKNAQLGDTVTTKEKKMVYNNAYDTLTDKGKEKLVITSDEEALAKLTPAEQELYKYIRGVFDQYADRLAAVAAIEGKAIDIEKYYFPMFSKSNYDDFQDRAEFLKDEIFSKSFENGVPEVIGSIHPKTNAINYIDFDAYRVTKNWVNDMLISEKLLPVINQQVRAINQHIKDIKDNKDISNEEKDRMITFLRNTKEDIKTGVIAEYTRSRLLEGGHNRFINVGKMLSDMTTYAKTMLVSTPLRIPADFIPNSESFGLYTIAKGVKAKLGNEANYWDDFISMQKGTIVSKKQEEFQNKLVMGTYEHKSIQKGKLSEITEKNIATGDNLSSHLAWISIFKQSYKDLVGKEFNVEKYTTDEAYRNKVDANDKFRSAMRMADREIERNLVPQTALSNKVLLGKWMYDWGVRARKGGSVWNIAVPLSMFSMNQSRRLLSDFRDIRYNTNQGWLRASYDVSKIVAQEMTYNMIMQTGIAGMKYLIAHTQGDEDKEQAALEMMKTMFTDPKSYMFAAIGSAGSLIIGGYGNLARAILGFGAVSAKQMIMEKQPSPERHRLEHDLAKYNMMVSRMFPTNIGAFSKNISFNDYLNFVLPVTAYGITTVGEGFKYGVIEPISDWANGKDINWVHAVNGINAVTALRQPLPISKDIDRMTKYMAQEFGDAQLPKDLMTTHLTYSYFTMLHDEAKKIFDDAVKKKLEDPKAPSGDDELSKYLSNDDGNYLTMFNYYNINKPFFNMIEEAYNGVKKSKTMTPEERKQVIEDLKSESIRLQDHYEAYEKNGKDIEYTPDKLMTIYEKIKMDYAKTMMEKSKDEGNYWSVVKGSRLMEAIQKQNK